MQAITDLQVLIQSLLDSNDFLKKKISDLENCLERFSKDNDRLRKENHELREKLTLYQHPKDSRNSHLPPSKDPPEKRIKSLRPPSDRPSGGQKGHPGKTLEMHSADEIQILSACYCTRCGKDLQQTEGEIIERRQQIDIPAITPTVTEYLKVRKVCTCSQVNQGEFPPTVTPGIGYGTGIMSLVTYLSVCQHIPYKRLIDLLKETLGLSLSQGSIDNILKRMEKRTYPAYEAIREKLSKSPVVGADETGIDINGKTFWAWVWQNMKLTYLTAARTREKKVFTDVMPQGMPDTILVTDCLPGYFSQKVAGHQICTAHILRELTYLSELYDKHPWSEQMSKLIRKGIHIRKKTKGKIDDPSIKNKFHRLLKNKIESRYDKIITLQKRLSAYKEYLFRFLQDENIPPDNNASERASEHLR